jgi:hypothetical protein
VAWVDGRLSRRGGLAGLARREIPPRRKRSDVGQPATHLVVGYPIRVVNWLMSK